MAKIHHYACLLPLLLGLSQPGWAADDLIATQMAEEARMWQQKDRDDLAAELWRKLLRATPQHPEALVNLGLIEARTGNLAQAAALRERARKLARAPAGLAQLDGAVRQLERARAPIPAAATSGLAPADRTRPARPSGAIAPASQPGKLALAALPRPATPAPAGGAVKPRAIAPATPRAHSAQAALAPFQTAAARGEHWEASRAGLEQLAQAHPDNPVYLLALAGHLGASEPSRREALRQLAALAARRDRPAGTLATWRAVLMQLQPRAGDEALYSQYQARFPRDRAIAARSASLQAGIAPAPDARSMVVDSGTSPVPERARTLLVEALAHERAGAYPAAAAKLERALMQAPASVAVRVALARQYEQLDRVPEAESLLDALLDAEPDAPAALHARARLYGQQQRWTEGLALLERIPAEQRDPSVRAQQRSLWIGAQLERARQTSAGGDAAAAFAIVTGAQQAAGDTPAQLVQVASAWNDIGQPARGLRLLRHLLGSGAADDATTRIVYAQILSDNFEDAELGVVLRDLASSGALTSGQTGARDRIALVHALRQAERLRSTNRLADAAALLSPWLERRADPRVLVAMARIRSAAGEPGAAMSLVEQAIALEDAALGHRLLACELAVTLNNPDKAAIHASAALGLAPRHPRALAAAGRVARLRGNWQEAQSYFQRARIAERDPAAFIGLPGSHALRLLDDAGAAPTPPAGMPP